MDSNDRSVAGLVKGMIEHYHVPVTSSEVDDFLLTHPHYPDLISISDAFDEWKIDHATVRIKPEQLVDVETPFMAKLKDFDESLALVRKIDDTYAYYQTNKNKAIKVDLHQFVERWDGVVIAVAPDEKSGEKDYAKRNKQEKLETAKTALCAAIVVSCLVLFLYVLFRQTAAELLLPVSLQVGVAALGILAGGFLYSYEKNAAPAFVKNMCKAGATFDCSSVLQSKASKVFGVVAWAEIGLVYFAGFFFSLVWAGNRLDVLSALALLSAVALPYTLFSMYYQAVVAKKWCVVCTAIQAFLWAQFLGFYFFDLLQVQSLSWSAAGILYGSFSLPTLLVIGLNTTLEKALKERELKKEARRLQQHPDIFKNMLHNSRKIDVNRAGDCIAGDPEAPITLTIATNLFCGPCAAAHEVLEEIRERHEDVRFQYVFTVPSDSDEKKATVQYIGAIFDQMGADRAQEALHFWFASKNFSELKKRFPVDVAAFDGTAFIRAHAEASSAMQIEFTPSLFINGYLLPDIYQVKEVPYWIPYLRQYNAHSIPMFNS